MSNTELHPDTIAARNEYAQARLKAKIRILEQNYSAQGIYDSLESEMQNLYHECSSNSFKVHNMPTDVQWEVDIHLELLDELSDFTYRVRTDADIPEHLEYITPHWNKRSDEDDDY